MTWLGFVNWYILRWFGIRLAKQVELNEDGSITESHDIRAWEILYSIHPRSSYGCKYRYLWGNECKSIRLWSKK